jgi:enoyl-CoA hydratase
MIEVEHRGAVDVLHLMHGKANVLDTAFCHAISHAVDVLAMAPARAAVIVGQGSIFSAGVDLVRVLEGGESYIKVFMPALAKAFEAVFACAKPIVAAVNGHAIAGGCVLACAADRRLMTDGDGRIGVPELIVGVPFPTIALEIMRQASPAHVEALVLTGANLAPREALERGVVHAVVEPGKLIDAALARAERLAAMPAAAFALAKRQLRAPAMKRVREDGPVADPTVLALWASDDTHAAIKAYAARTFRKT